MFSKRHIIFFLLMPALFFSCSTTKYVPENKYLLNKVTIKTDNKKISSSDLEEYVQQMPNSNFLFLKKLSLKTYSLSGRDTSKWRNRFIRKIGDAPVIFSAQSMKGTEKQITQRLQNLGYLRAEVTSDTTFKKKKANVTYNVRSNAPYTIHRYNVEIKDSMILSMLESPRLRRTLNIQPGARFVPEDLDKSLQTLVNSMRNRGYYNLTKENFYFQVDSALNANQVDVKLKIRDTWDSRDDSIRHNVAFNRYRINDVTIISGYDQFDPTIRSNFLHPDTVEYNGLKIVYGSHHFLRKNVLYYNNFLRPGNYYSDLALENTYSSLNSMGTVKQTNIYFREVHRPDTFLLNTFITLAPSNIYYWQLGVDGTNTGGDPGIAGYATFQNKNIFNGSETFRIRLNGGLESISSSGSNMLSNNYFQYGVDLSLTFPRILVPFIARRIREQPNSQTVFTAGLNWKNRPEYNQRFLNLDWIYRWSALRNRLNHTFHPYNVNYIATPWASDTFLTYLNRPENAVLRENYNGLFITRTTYSNVYTNRSLSRSQMEGYSIRTSLDIAGTLPYIISRLSGTKGDDGTYKVFNIPFAQYFKVNADFARIFRLDYKNFVAFRVGLGLASPYLNSTLIPYEQRFYAGGPNSVRGWSTRTLGPGSYLPAGKNDFVNQTGDVRILFNLEYRLKTGTFLEYAAFFDAGNIWTIRDYEHQPGGFFKWNSFLKEMALAWGIGIRPNFKFILIRLDIGMKIYSPIPLDGKQWVITSPRLGRDFAYHFAIGYPF
ncbi:MAG: BamA/TamA family outer membrane protein [Prevotellaceae bacterium]|jgi:outer membrane protein assembly factor BamA|nr:BamA/TamA family outer membrane protein [Prevotellaceae bacterium]